MTIEQQVIKLYITEHLTEDIIARKLGISEERVVEIIGEFYDPQEEAEELGFANASDDPIPDFFDWEEDQL